MTILATIQDDILALLRSAYPDLEVEPFPDRPENRATFHPVATLLLAYGGSRDSAPLDVPVMAQMRTTRWDINIVAHDLDGARGAITLVDGVRATLIGRMAAGGEIRIASDRFRRRVDAVWQFAVSIEVALPMVPTTILSNDPTLLTIDLKRDGIRQGGVPLAPV